LSIFIRRIARGLSRNHAETAAAESDPRLRGRTYAIPFEQVWQAARQLAGGGLRGWKTLESDDYEGVIRAESRTLIFRFLDEVTITIRLDDDAQTRVDMQSRSRKGGVDFGTNARRIGKFFRALDQKLNARNRLSHTSV
jgi:hypothetical protein